YQGTLFLDEIGELPFNAQATLLRALQEKTIYRVGGVVGLPIDVRIIAATNADLQKLVEDKLFREDLYYRLNVLPLYIPPLRERIEDIPLLIEHFTHMYNAKYKKSISIEKQDYDLFMNYTWPGNVRELKNLIERVSIISNEDTIPRHVWIRHLSNNEKDFNSLAENKEISLKAAVEEYERNLLLSYMPKYKNSRQFAKLLGTDKTTINRKLQKYNIRKNND
ncbi:MAG: sigma 54-interacting transcriptional regulator, partial [Parabacteroides sp.]|nr:sigma 54-interacting transcriptional regulator [Parabacteroides sp.]